MNFKGDPLNFLKAIGQGAIKLGTDVGTSMGNFLYGNPLDEYGNVKPLNEGYQAPSFEELGDHQKEKIYQDLREDGPQSSAVPFLGDFLKTIT